MTGVLADSATIGAPSIEYGQLAPMLVVFLAAVAGILVEAFAPRPSRRTAHLILSLGSLAAAFILVIVVATTHSLYAAGSPGHVAAEGAVAVDRPTLFIQGTILILAFLSVLLIAGGVYPKPVLDIINPAVRVTMTQVRTTDPKPAHPAPGTTTTSILTRAAQKGVAP